LSSDTFTSFAAGTQVGLLKLYGVSTFDSQVYLEQFDATTGALVDSFALTAPGLFTKLEASP
jgi:hypothetical protein